MTALLTILGGLFGGAGATVVWEVFLKPARESRAFARLLLTETLVNRRIIQSRLQATDASREFPPKGFRLYTTIFDSNASRLADLPTSVAALVYWSYRYFDRLMAVADRYWDNVERHGPDLNGEKGHVLQKANESTWQTYLSNSIISLDKTRVALEFAALPLWSRRRRRLRAQAKAYAEEMASFVSLPAL